MVQQNSAGMGLPDDDCEYGLRDSARLKFLAGGYEKSKRKFRKVFRRRSYIGDLGISGNRFTDRTRTSRDTLPTMSDSTTPHVALVPGRDNGGIKASSFHASNSNLNLNAHYNARKTSSFHIPNTSYNADNDDGVGFQSSSFPLPDTPPTQRHQQQQQAADMRTTSFPYTSTQRHGDIQSSSFPIPNGSSRGGSGGAQETGLFRVDSNHLSTSSSQIPDDYPIDNANVPSLDSYYQPTRLKISPNVTDDPYEGQIVQHEPPNSRMRLCDLTSTGKYVAIAEEIDAPIRVHDDYVSFVVPHGWAAQRTAWGFYLFHGDYLGFICAASSKNATSMLLSADTTDRLGVFSKVRVLSSPVFESTHTAVVNYVAHDLKGRGIAQYNAGFTSGAVVFALCAPQEDADKLQEVEDFIARHAVVIETPPYDNIHHSNGDYNRYSDNAVGKTLSTSSIVWNKICNVIKRR